MRKIAQRGFTLVEMLIVIAILGIVAKVAIPLLSSNDPQKLSVAAEETANLLRFALSEAKRAGGFILVDGKNTVGHLKVYYSSNNGNLTSAVIDPMTKRAFDVDISTNAFTQGVTLTPKFMAGGTAWPQLLISPTGMQGFDGLSNPKGALEANSGVLLSYGGQNVLVSIHHVTGLATLP